MSNCDQLDDTTRSPAESSDKIANRNIKERLNLHVKRRLQESTTDPSSTFHSHSQSAFNIQTTSPVATSKRGAPSERGTGTHCGRGGKRSRNTKQLAATISLNSSSTGADDECSRDGSSNCTTDVSREKEHSPDILTMVLNQKKLSLFHDPEVMQFLDGIVEIIAKKAEDSGGAFGLIPFNHDQTIASGIDFILMIIFPVGYSVCFIYVFSLNENIPLIQNCRTICSTGHFLFIELGGFMFVWSFLLNLTKRRFFIDFNRAMDDIRDELVKCNSKLMAKNLVKNRKIKIATAVSVALIFSFGMIFDAYSMFAMLGITFPIISITYTFPFWIGCLIQLQFITFINMIAENFEWLNDVLVQICEECDKQKNFKFKLFDIQSDFIQKSTLKNLEAVKKLKQQEKQDEDDEPQNTERYLVNVFRIHNKLYQTGVATNRAYAVQIVCYMAVSFVIIVFGIFLETKVIFLVGGINKYLDYMAHSYALWAVSLSVVAYIVLRLCCRVQREAKRSALLVHEIMQRKPAFMLGNDIYYNRMKCFTLQYLHWENYFHFNGLGLFQLDYTFIFSAISAATSYLIVLLQFDLTSEITRHEVVNAI